jgi:ABC-2 type transport system ATP-binding protein
VSEQSARDAPGFSPGSVRLGSVGAPDFSPGGSRKEQGAPAPDQPGPAVAAQPATQIAQYSPQAVQQYHFDPSDWVVASWGLSKWYGLVLGLNNFTIGVRPGITGLLGPNGAGKSTFMKLVTGQLRASQGRLWVLGQEPRNNTRLRSRIGYCPEQDSFYPWMSGLQFVEYLARLNGMSVQQANAAARRAIAAVDMTADMGRTLGGYSKGMRQRIKIAQSIVHEPELVILDEPLGGTDPLARVRIMEVISDLEKAGRQVLISSHVLHEVERMTENIVLIHKGMLLAQGNLHDIRDLIDKHPHTVMVQTPEPRRLAAELDGFEYVASLDFLPGQLTVRTTAPEAFYRELPRVIARTGIPYTGISSPDDNLNAVFKYLTEG